MADRDIPAEAVEAAAAVLQDLLDGGNGLGDHWIKILPGAREHYRRQVTPILAAALPHIRARVLAEVDAALRDVARYQAWADEQGIPYNFRWHKVHERFPDYLRDVLGAGGKRGAQPAESHGERSGYPGTPGNRRTDGTGEMAAAT